MAALLDTIEGRKIAGHRPCPRLVVDEDGWRFAANQLSAGYWTLLGLWGDTGAVHMAVLDDDAREIAVVTMPCPDGHFPLGRSTRLPFAWSARCAISTASNRSAPRTRGPGSISAVGMCGTRSENAVTLPRGASLTPSCPPPVKACTGFPSARFMPASSSPGISVLPPTARRWFGWSSALVTCTRASRR